MQLVEEKLKTSFTFVLLQVSVFFLGTLDLDLSLQDMKTQKHSAFFMFKI